MWLPGIVMSFINVQRNGYRVAFIYMHDVILQLREIQFFLLHFGYDYDRCGCSFDVLLDLEWLLCFVDELSTLLG